MPSDNERLEPQQVLIDQLETLRRRRSVRRLVLSMFITFMVVFIVFRFIFGIGRVEGDSMSPALENGDLVLFWRLSQSYAPGDMVILRKNAGHGEQLVKRIVGTPYDELDVHGGKVYVNEEAESGSWVSGRETTAGDTVFPLVLDESSYFVLGDNREKSQDSRSFGSVESIYIDGKVILSIHIS